MSDFLKRIAGLSPERLALLAAELKTRLERAEGALAQRNEPIAVIGIGCRFPGGADSPESYWKLLHDGVDAVREVPAERWDVEHLYDGDPDAPGKMATKWGAFLDRLEDFDPWFFGIAPREAMRMDPQQRVLLEVAWEALENAGLSPERMEDSETGVFLGLCNQDYHALRLERPFEEIDSYFASGVAGSMAAGRIAYLLGLHGPALTVDTACSSSLVALHLACESLRNGESRTALAAGVSLILTPETMIGLSKSRILSTDGKCRTFDEAASGIARGEGCAVVVLKRLSDARADGDRVLAVIRATALNQDGRSSGITAPNGAAQEALLHRTLAKSGLRPADIDFVEAHGTGTSLGDPIEVRALAAVYGDRPAERPLLIGSVKTNLGHLEAAAGLAGFVKLVLALQAREIPPHLHLRRKNPHVQWSQIPVGIPTALTPWVPAAPDQPRRGAVSSFGFSGTNAHVIVEEAPADVVAPAAVERPAHALVLSARSPAVLATLATRYAELLERADAPALPDVCHTAATGRAAFAHRLAIVGSSAADVARALRTWSESGDAEGVVSGKAASGLACEPVFLFTGQGSQSAGMGKQLFETEPVFRAALERCDALLRPHLEVPLLQVMHPAADASAEARALIDRTEYAQPALFALEYAMSELWRSWGVRPAAVVGHSLGEYVAATVAGLFSLEDALRIVARRGRLMQSLPAGGAMAAVFAPLARLEAIVARHADTLSIAAVNGHENVVLSGSESVLDRVLAELLAQGISSRRLVVSHAFHSPLMEPVLDAFERLFDGVTFGEPDVPIISNLSGEAAAPGEMARAGYWREHLRRPVRFLDDLLALEAMGHRTFLEVGPHPTLTGLASACLARENLSLVHSLRRGQGECEEMLRAAGALFVRGVHIDWDAVDAPWPRRTVPLPLTPFERRRFWSGWSEKARRVTPAADRTSGWTWELEWVDTPGQAALANPATIATRLTPVASELVERFGARDYDQGLPMLDALCTSFIVRAFRVLGSGLHAGDRIVPDDVQERLGITHAHDRLFRRMLGILTEDGILSRDGDVFVVRETPRSSDPQQLAAALRESAPGLGAELAMTLRCGLALPDVLRGAADPLELLFPGGSTDEAAALYSDSPSFRVFNTLVRDAVLELVAARAGKPTRILEIGGGTGSVTKEIVPELAREGVRYVFTDVSPLFGMRAMERFGQHPGFEARALDISRDPVTQGFETGSFDVVVASNVLHATPDLAQTLAHVRSLLAPGGVLVVLEGVLPQRFGDLTVGLTEGWWSFTDSALRPDYALLDPQRWMRLLADTGFEASAAFPDMGDLSTGVLAQQRVLLARKPMAETTSPSHWIAVTGGGDASASVVNALAQAGVEVTAIASAPEEALASALTDALSRSATDGVLHLASLDAPIADDTDGPDALEQLRQPCESALTLVRVLARRGGPRLAIVTRSAEATHTGEAVDPSGAPLRGLARNVALEHPELRCVAIDLEPGQVDGAALAAALVWDPREDQIALRNAGTRVPRIRQAPLAVAASPLRFEKDAAYLVTGGLSGLGLRVARWMAERGAGTLVLTGRHTPTDAARAEIAAMERAGARVAIVQGDVAEPSTVAAMLAAAEAPVRGVMHAAGATDDATLAVLDWERMRHVMQAKVAGSWNLHRATRDLALDHFVLFSSGAAFLGSPGQANHAAANAYMGALAWHRQAQGLPALAVDWGPWSEIGAATRDGVLERARAAGLHAIDPEGGLAVLERLMCGSAARVAVLPVDWDTYLERVPAGADRAWFSPVRRTAARPSAETREAVDHAPAEPAAASGKGALRSKVAAAVAGRRREVLLDGIRAIAQRVLGANGTDDIDPATPLTELGLDSLMAVEMRNRMAAALDRTLPATLLFNHPSLDALTDFLLQEFEPSVAAPRYEPPAREAVPVTTAPSDLDDLSEDEVADLLAEKLKNV